MSKSSHKPFRAFLALALIEASAALGDIGNLLAQDRASEDNMFKYGGVICGLERAAAAVKKAQETEIKNV